MKIALQAYSLKQVSNSYLRRRRKLSWHQPSILSLLSLSNPSISLDLSLEQVDAPLQSSLLQQLKQQLTRSEIHLKYQQIYDKHDQETHNYEVTSGFISDDQWYDINDLAELREDSELSIQLDRWIFG